MVSVPLAPAMTIGVAPELVRAAALMGVPPTLIEARPSGALMAKLPLVVASSATLASEPPMPAPSLGTETVGTPSLAPAMLTVRVAVVLSPSLSVTV